jgi:signal transduction histidine kinase
VPRQGEERWVSLAAQGTHYGTKESSVIRWLIRDVHEETLASQQRARVESELRSSIRELEASKLLFDKLCEVAQVAQQPSQPVPTSDESLLGEVAHEMRTPLGSIAGWLHILSQEQHGDIARRALASMTRSVRVLAKLTEDLLDHTRFTEQGIKLDRTPINLLRLLIHTVEDARPLAELKRLQLKFSAHPHRIELHVDPVRLQQLFRNLIGNALKFTPSGGSVRVSVTVAQHAAVVTIADSGKGIAAGALETIFEPFAQVERARGQEAGVGLGLSIARRIAELHGGTVTAESDGLGKGALFRVTLPFTTFN